MEINETKACIRAVLTSTHQSYTLPLFLTDFKVLSGVDLPCYGFKNPEEFLLSIPDTVKVCFLYIAFFAY